MRTAFERRDEMRDFLLTHRRTTVQALAEEFDVSVDTVKRDIAVLTVSLPIDTARGRGGGVFLLCLTSSSNTAVYRS